MKKVLPYIYLLAMAGLLSACGSFGSRSESDTDSSREGVEKICQQYNESVSNAAYHNCVNRYMGTTSAQQVR